MESANHSLSHTIPHIFPARGSVLNNMAADRSQSLSRDREKLGQSAIGIASYQGAMDTLLDLTNYIPV